MNKTKQYGIYHLRWQISGIIMYPALGILATYNMPLWLSVMVAQFIGAIVFFEIDKRIFGHHDKDTTEMELEKALEPSVSDRKL